MFDDEVARHALRTLNDEPAPPAGTTLDRVLRRGRRRVLARRASAAAAVVAVVAAAGVGALWLRPADPGPGGVPAATTTSTPTRTDGWEPVTPRRVGGDCPDLPRHGPAEADIPLPPEAAVNQAFVETAAAVLGAAPTTTSSDWGFTTTELYGPRGIIFFDLGGAEVQLMVSRHGGTPRQAADWWSARYGHCEPLRRHALADGTVLLVYPVLHESPMGPLQQAQLFRPDGLDYLITSVGTVDGGLPVTEVQLAALAERLGENLG
jgi:hypothetical protein